MKIASTVARVLLGLLFTVFGLNGFLNFIPMGPMPTGSGGQFITALMQSHYMFVVLGLEIATGILLLLNQYVPLALTLLAPVIVNIFLFHAFMDPDRLPLAILAVALWTLSAYSVRSIYQGLFDRSMEAEDAR